MSKAHVVVIGGSFAGVTVINALVDALNKQVRITLIEERDSMYIAFGGLRAVTDPDPISAERVWAPYTNLFKNKPDSKVIQQRATEVHPDKVVLADGSQVEFDYLVIATGSNVSFGKSRKLTRAEGIKESTEINAVLKQAKSVAVIGGGVVGVELVGELASDLPHLQVHLVHSGPYLMDTSAHLYPEKLFKAISDGVGRFKSNVTIHLDSKVVPPQKTGKLIPDPAQGYCLTPLTHTTTKGETIEADVTFVTVGVTGPNSSLIQTLGNSLTDERGYIKTRTTGQVEGFDNIFALGDVSNLDPAKLGYIPSNFQGPIVGQNIASLVRGQDKLKLKEYTPVNNKTAMIVVPLGRSGGVGYLPPVGLLPSLLVWLVKGRYLFTDMYWGKVKASKEYPASKSGLSVSTYAVIAGAGLAVVAAYFLL